MTISMDKKYRTKSGKKVRLLCINAPNTDQPVIGIINDNGDEIYGWDLNGVWLPGQSEGNYDLIEIGPLEIKVGSWYRCAGDGKYVGIMRETLDGNFIGILIYTQEGIQHTVATFNTDGIPVGSLIADRKLVEKIRNPFKTVVPV